MKTECRVLLRKAADSLVLGIEHFNRPSDRGRVTIVLILFDHAFEMLLKAAIVHRGGRIKEPGEDITISFDKCLAIAVSDGRIKFLTEDQASVLRALNGLRDGEQHFVADVDEHSLFLLVQSGFTIFTDVYADVFGRQLRVELPQRVLPVSTTPPVDIPTAFYYAVEEVRKLLQPGARRRFHAYARLRSLAIIERAFQGNPYQPPDAELKRAAKALQNNASLESVFPTVSALAITATGYGPSLELRITKHDGVPIRLVRAGDTDEEHEVVLVKHVRERDFYNLTRNALAEHVGLTTWQTSAMIWYLNLQSDDECYRDIGVGRTRLPRYSRKAIIRIRDGLEAVSMQEVWHRYRNRAREQASA